MRSPDPYAAIVLADSIAEGVRLTTLCCTFPRIVLAEFNTHRVFSRNSASSRAIPVERRIAQIRENPYVPLQFGANKAGMSAGGVMLGDYEQIAARGTWVDAMHNACDKAERLSRLGLHKQWANRLLEPFAWHTAIVSATEWANFFALRIHGAAQPEIRKVAESMKAAMDESAPFPASAGWWHLPLVGPEDGNDADVLVKLSVARCAAVSYERHMERDAEKEIARYELLHNSGHMSPFEHAAKVGNASRGFIGNFRAPWIQHRKMLVGEDVWTDPQSGGPA